MCEQHTKPGAFRQKREQGSGWSFTLPTPPTILTDSHGHWGTLPWHRQQIHVPLAWWDEEVRDAGTAPWGRPLWDRCQVPGTSFLTPNNPERQAFPLPFQ